MSFLRVFQSILHAMESAAVISAPLLAALAPDEAPLVAQSVNTALLLEAVITNPGSGAQREAILKATTDATVGLTNSLLVSQGKPPLSANVAVAAAATAKNVVDTLNVVANAVQPVAAAAAKPGA